MSDTEDDENVSFSHVDVETEGFCERLGSSWVWMCIGIILLFGSIGVLFWNEGRNVRRIKDLTESEKMLVSLPNATFIDPQYEGSHVHVVGKIGVTNNLTDSDFGVSVSGVHLRRRVETYQWKEESERRTREKLGGSKVTETVYSYRRVWNEGLIDSNRFRRQDDKRRNPTTELFSSLFLSSSPVTLGAFDLSQEIVSKMSWWTFVPGLNASAVTLPDSSPNGTTVQLINNNQMIYIGATSPSNPRVGDLRITMEYVPTDTASVLAQQRNNQLVPFRTSRGGEILLVERGDVTAEQLIDDARGDNTVTTWLLRFGGFAFILLGFVLCFDPCITFANVIPIVGDILEGGICCLGFVVSAFLSSFTIGLAWLFYRPVISGVLVAVSVAIGAGVWFLMKRKKTKELETVGDFDMEKQGSTIKPFSHSLQ